MGRWPHDNGGRDLGDVATSPGIPGGTGDLKWHKRSSPRDTRGSQTAHTSVLNLWPPNVHSYCCKPPGSPKTHTANKFLKPPRTQCTKGVVHHGSTGLAGATPGGLQQRRFTATPAQGLSELLRAGLLGMPFQSSLNVARCANGRTSPTSLLSPRLPVRGSPRHALCCAVLSRSAASDSETSWAAARQAPLSTGSLQARVLGWVAMPSSRGSSQSRD